MKTIKYEIKLEKSVKIILGIFAVGVLLNAFETPVGKELFGVKDLNAGLAKRNLETVQQEGRFTEVFDENNLNHQEMALHYDENPRTLGLYKGSTNQASVNLERIKEKARDVGSVITHEDLHAITIGKSGYTDEAKDILNSAVGKDQDWWLNKINTTKDQKKREELIDQLEYLARPQEIHARVHELRKAFNLKPGQEVSPSKIEAIMTKGLKGETPVDEGFFRLLGDKENFRKIFIKNKIFSDKTKINKVFNLFRFCLN